MGKRTKFFWWKITITIISLLGVIGGKSSIDWSNLSNNHINPAFVKDIIYNLSVGVFSAMILVWFIDEISNHIQEHQSKDKEISEIKRFDKVLQCYIKQYVTLFYCVVTPIDKRNFKGVTMPEKFSLSDMRDLHKTSLLIKDKIAGASVETFLQIELELRKEFVSLVERYDFEYHPQFVQIFLEYIQTSLNYDCRDVILDAPNKMIGAKKLTDFVHDLLQNEADSFYRKMLNGENMDSNIAHPYIFLYEMMQQERKSILQYQEEIQKLG